MARKVTLYIEDTDIKLLVTKGEKVEKWASLLLEPSLVRDGVIIDEDRVAESIKTLLKLGGVSKKKVVVGLSGLNSIFRIITLPEISQALLPEAVMNEARRVIPVPLEQVYISYQQIPSAKGEMQIFLVAYPRNSTDILIKTVIKAGLKVDKMDLAPLALSRCANEARAIIINSWLTYIDIIIMTDGLPQVIRSMSLLTEAVAVEEKLPFIAEEFARTVAFYNSSNPRNQLDSTVPVFVCGDLAETPDSWQLLVGKKGYPVSTLIPPIQFPETFSPCKFMVNIGLALKGQLPKGADYSFSVVDFNALPEVYRPVVINIYRIIAPVAIVIAIGALAFGGLLIKDVNDETALLNSQIDGLDFAISELRSQITGVEEAIDEKDKAIEPLPLQAEQIESEIQSLEESGNEFGNMLANLSEGLEKTDADMQEVIDLLPATINLFNVQYDSDSMVSITGIATNEDDIFSYARALRSSERFNEVIILSIEEIFKKEYEEEIRMFNFRFLIR